MTRPCPCCPSPRELQDCWEHDEDVSFPTPASAAHRRGGMGEEDDDDGEFYDAEDGDGSPPADIVERVPHGVLRAITITASAAGSSGHDRDAELVQSLLTDVVPCASPGESTVALYMDAARALGLHPTTLTTLEGYVAAALPVARPDCVARSASRSGVGVRTHVLVASCRWLLPLLRGFAR